MGCSRVTILVVVVVCLLFSFGCTRVGIATHSDAIELLKSEKPEVRNRAFAYFYSQSKLEREHIGLLLLLSEDTFLGFAGISLLSSVQPSENTWSSIEQKCDNSVIARRYSILSQKFLRTASLTKIVSFLPNAHSEDIGLFLRSLEAIEGFSLGTAEEESLVLFARWQRQLIRRKNPDSREAALLLSRLIMAETSVEAVSIVHSFKPADFQLVLADLILLKKTGFVEIGRELAIVFGDASDDGTVLELLNMLSSRDFLTRFNAYHSLEKRTGMSILFHPDGSEKTRNQEIRKLRGILHKK